MQEAEKQFIKYGTSYKKYGPKIEMKMNHTMRVKDLCIELAKSINLSEEDVVLAAMCGLLHDIGRFEQWKRFETYVDRKSIDHGNLGADILKKDMFINKFTNKNQNTIILAVKYHNKIRVPNTLSEKNKLFANITRDADKIDILNLVSTNKIQKQVDTEIINDKAYQSLMNKKCVSTKDVKSPADEIAVVLGFVYDLNYQKSYEIIKNNNYMNIIIDNQIKSTNSLEYKKQLEKLQKDINQYIEEMKTC